jgi:aspartate aminotransferase
MKSSPLKIELSRRVLSVAPSVTLAIAARAAEMKAQGKDVVSLSAGEPDFDTPAFIKDAAITALQKGQTKYTPAIGTIDLRKAVAAKLKRDQGLDYPANQIIVSTGAKHSIFNVLFALLNEGDEVAIPAPFWLSYPEMVTVLGGKSVLMHTDESTDFKLTPEILRKGLSAKTKVLILNSPSNPTGAVYSKEEMLGLVQVLKEFPNVVVISDEIYEKLIYDGRKHYCIASLDSEIAERTIVINGLSKAYAMTGWRLGYAAFPNKEIADAAGSIQSHSTSNATSFSQAGGVVALEKGEEEAIKLQAIFEKRRTSFYDQISKVPHLKPFKAQGAFYLWVNCADSKIDSVTLSDRLLAEALVAVVPGKPFGSDKHIRLSFATSDQQLAEASKRLHDWFSKL